MSGASSNARPQQKRYFLFVVGLIGYLSWLIVNTSNVTNATASSSDIYFDVPQSFSIPTSASCPPAQKQGTRTPKLAKESTIRRINLAAYNATPRIFHCGNFSAYDQYRSVMTSVFPEYEWEDIGNETFFNESKRGQRKILYRPFVTTYEWDIFINHWDHQCPMDVFRWLWQWFQGKSVFVYPESPIAPRPVVRSNFIELGPHERVADDHNHVLLTFLQASFWHHYSPEERLLLTDHSQKPRNSGKHFLIYANSNCQRFREDAFRYFSRLGKEVFYAGRCSGRLWAQKRRAVTTFIENNVTLDTHHDNRFLFADFRFCLVLEHDKTAGYITEKILNAFVAGCIPIYYGTDEIFDMFNRKAFVYYDPENFNQSLTQVLHLESNQTAYNAMMREPILANGEETVRKYFSLDENWGGGYLKKEIRSLVGLGVDFEFVS
jgi:hypothetical protein